MASLLCTIFILSLDEMTAEELIQAMDDGFATARK